MTGGDGEGTQCHWSHLGPHLVLCSELPCGLDHPVHQPLTRSASEPRLAASSTPHDICQVKYSFFYEVQIKSMSLTFSRPKKKKKKEGIESPWSVEKQCSQIKQIWQSRIELTEESFHPENAISS